MTRSKNQHFRIRNYRNQDWEGLKKLYSQYLGFPLQQANQSDRLFALQMKRSGFRPEDNVLIAEIQGHVAGYLMMIAESPIKRMIFDVFISPDFRRQGIGSALFSTSLKRLENSNFSRLHICVPEFRSDCADFFLSRRDFLPKRKFQTMKADLSLLPEVQDLSENVRTDFFRSGDEGKLARIQNAVFQDSWGFCPNSTQDIPFYLEMTGCALQEIVVLTGGEEIWGYVWPHFYDLPGQESQGKKCRIHMFGVLPQYRGKGKGKALLISALHRFRDKGFSRIELTVDKENQGAVGLYESLGFNEKDEMIWYEKRLESR